MTTEQSGECSPEDAIFISGVLTRIVREYQALPGLVLTVVQIQRIWSLTPAECAAVIDALTRARILRRTASGAYGLDGERSDHVVPSLASCRRDEQPSVANVDLADPKRGRPVVK